MSKLYKNELADIGRQETTDKARHSWHGESMLDIYERYLIERREENLKVLEFGVLRGASLRTFQRYLPNAKIVGVDIDHGTKFDTPNIEVVVGSQTDEKVLAYMINNYGTFDFILDDASHVNDLTLKTFEMYWPIVAANGIYIIEDTLNMLAPAMKSWPGMNFNDSNTDYNNEQKDLSDFVTELLMNLQGINKKFPSISSFHVYTSSLIVKKSPY